MTKNPRIIAGILILVLSMTLMGVLAVLKSKAPLYKSKKQTITKEMP